MDTLQETEILTELTSTVWNALDSTASITTIHGYTEVEFLDYAKSIIIDTVFSLDQTNLQDIIDKYDLAQQLQLIWLKAKLAYKNSECSNSCYESYLIRLSVWGIRDWIIKQVHIVTTYPYYYFTKESPRFLLNLNFLMHGTKIFPYSELSPYERYLIFLHFRDERTIVEIAYIVQKNRNDVAQCLHQTIEKLRRLSNETENPG